MTDVKEEARRILDQAVNEKIRHGLSDIDVDCSGTRIGLKSTLDVVGVGFDVFQQQLSGRRVPQDLLTKWNSLVDQPNDKEMTDDENTDD